MIKTVKYKIVYKERKLLITRLLLLNCIKESDFTSYHLALSKMWMDLSEFHEVVPLKKLIFMK